ncbi:unnamed protein product [Effrenium voratum]|nr:unnamed protein product [Effrenium voratum]
MATAQSRPFSHGCLQPFEGSSQKIRATFHGGACGGYRAEDLLGCRGAQLCDLPHPQLGAWRPDPSPGPGAFRPERLAEKGSTTTCEDVSDPAIVTRESSTEPSPTQTSTDPCVFFSSQRGCALGAACGFRHGAGEITGPRPRKVTRDKLKAVIARVCKNLEDPNTHAKLQKLAGGCHYLRSLIIQKLNDDASSCARRHG